MSKEHQITPKSNKITISLFFFRKELEQVLNETRLQEKKSANVKTKLLFFESEWFQSNEHLDMNCSHQIHL